MKMSEEFSSKYLRAADLKDREVKVFMSHCEREEVGKKDGRPDIKPVLYFKGKEKGIVLNKTNATVISDFYGDDSDDWADQPIILFSVKTDFQGKVVDGLRCRIPTAKENRPAQHREDPISSGPPPGHPANGPAPVPGRAIGNSYNPPSDRAPTNAELNDDIPF